MVLAYLTPPQTELAPEVGAVAAAATAAGWGAAAMAVNWCQGPGAHWGQAAPGSATAEKADRQQAAIRRLEAAVDCRAGRGGTVGMQHALANGAASHRYDL